MGLGPSAQSKVFTKTLQQTEINRNKLIPAGLEINANNKEALVQRLVVIKKIERFCSQWAETQIHSPLNINITHTVVIIGSHPLKMSLLHKGRCQTDLYSFFHLL